MNLSRLGMGEDPAVRKTEFNDVSSVGETHTPVPPESEIPNRFMLQLSSIAEEPPEHEESDVCYNVEDIPIGSRDVLRDHLAAACAHELHLTQCEWEMITTYLTSLDKPRKCNHRTNGYKSKIGVSRASDFYGHNTDVDDTMFDALFTQYMVSDDQTSEVILITEQVNSDGLVTHIEEQKVADLKTVPVEQHYPMLQAIAKEFNDLIAIGTFASIEVPANRKAISSRIVLKVKHRADGAFDKYKARLVARGFLQKLGVDFFSTFSPMATLTSIRMLLAIAVHNNLDIIHADIPQAFLKARLDTDIWLQLPPGITFKDKEGKVLKCVKLIRSLYGLRDSPSNFNKELVRFMVSACRFKQLECDKCVFYHFDESTKKFVLVGCEVDDLVITGNDAACISRLKKRLMDDYNVKDWERIASFLGINIDYDLDSGVLSMDVKSKIEKLFDDHSILNVLKNVKCPTPITEDNLNVPDAHKQKWAPIDHYIADKYASINGAIIYMSITCRPDITFAIGKTSRGMHQPTPAHVAALKHLISYMWRTRDFKFRYLSTGCNVRSHLRGISSQDASISLYAGSDGQLVDPAVGFADANFAHVSDEQRKSISGYCFFMYFCLICWRSKLQTVTAQSTHEAELIAVALASNELIWIRKFMIELGFAIGACTPIARPVITGSDHDLPEIDSSNSSTTSTITDFAPECAKEDADDARFAEKFTIEPPYLFNDNKGTTQTVNNPVTNSNTKHVATKEFRTRQYIAQRLLRVCYIPTDMNIADFFTKALTETPFCKFRAFLGISE